jgi:uroporphyrinogen decarboxylase
MSLNIPYRPEHVKMAAELVSAMEKNDGLAPMDLERFWAEQDAAIKAPFGRDIAQAAFGGGPTPECVCAELGIEQDFWRYDHDHEWRRQLNIAYNDKAERILGRRFLNEQPYDPKRVYPPVKELHDVFEAKNIWQDQSWWLLQCVKTPDELSALLDRVAAMNIREYILPPNWAEEKARLTTMGIKPPIYRDQRGPVTFATSIYGTENLIYLILEQPELAQRFSNAILKTMLEIGRVLDEEAGYTPETAPRGFSFRDDNCYLLTPDMYRFFAYPILKGVFERYAPDPNDWHYQHSDSDMEHLLPLLNELGLNEVNLGPTVMADEIRRQLPHAVICGQLGPFTYSRNELNNVVLEFLRDFEMTRESRGLVFTTAGSIHNGTKLTTMRLAMAAIQKYGRY